MNGKNYSVNAQRCKYVVTDLVMTYIAFFIFNIFRYDYVTAAAISASTLWKFLTIPKVTMELIFVPLVLSAIYVLSGYYNNPLIKSRLSELSSTFLTALSNTLIIFMFMLINDSSGMRSRGLRHYRRAFQPSLLPHLYREMVHHFGNNPKTSEAPMEIYHPYCRQFESCAKGLL